MKDDHQNDHLEVAVQTPDGTFYKVIPSKFLWTTLPTPPGMFKIREFNTHFHISSYLTESCVFWCRKDEHVSHT